jgi:hypothetical protein
VPTIGGGKRRTIEVRPRGHAGKVLLAMLFHLSAGFRRGLVKLADLLKMNGR